VTDNGVLVPTFIRLPGYPAFLALIFAIFGMEHYRTVLVIQSLLDMGTCLIIADMARRTISPRGAKVAFSLAALCPFLANYAAAALTETLEIFFTALALDLAITGIEGFDRNLLRPWVRCGAAVGAATLLRPDGGLLLIAVGLYLGIQLIRDTCGIGQSAKHILRAAAIMAAIALAPLIPWTLRNFLTLHRLQPIAPRYANEENEFVPAGFNRWVKTWMVDYVSVEEIYWAVPGNPIEPKKLPSRTFDSESQHEKTLELIDTYNAALHFSPDLDRGFAQLAGERIHAAPASYYLTLPMLRVTDMWLRPRTELLPSDTRWWEFNDAPEWSALAIGLGIINLFYVGAAGIGLLRRRPCAGLGLLLFFIVLRSFFLATLENPEPRYTLECYPLVILLASTLFTKQ
jgi:4-amino-4-deoxy-L-arabinose transferase-like glycosyltransferase